MDNISRAELALYAGSINHSVHTFHDDNIVFADWFFVTHQLLQP